MKKLLTATLFLATALALSVPARAGGPWRDGRPITVGHRGTPLLADENTLEAYAMARDYGLDMFECDPRLTRDGVYVIMHDETVDRTTNGTGKVSDMTLAEIKRLRTKSGHRVPTFKEALDFARDNGMGVYIDIKEPGDDTCGLLIRTVIEAKMADRVIAGCYERKTLRAIERMAPEISTCVSWPWPAFSFADARGLGADAVGTLAGLASEDAIEKAHRNGLKVITMPINNESEVRDFLDRGLDAIQTDDPKMLGGMGIGK